MYKLFKSTHQGLGTSVEVHIDEQEGLIKRYYKSDAITVNGAVTKKTHAEITESFEYEKYWLCKLESEWIPKTVEIGKDYIIQEYTGPALIDSMPNLPDIKEQIIEMYKFFKFHGVYKRNGSVSNLVMNNNQLVAFDFKWARHRPIGIDMELRSYDEWLIKIDVDLPMQLRELL